MASTGIFAEGRGFPLPGRDSAQCPHPQTLMLPVWVEPGDLFLFPCPRVLRGPLPAGMTTQAESFLPL